MGNITQKKKNIIKGALESASNYYKTYKNNLNSDVNIMKLASEHGITSSVYGANNYNTVINKAKEFAKQGNMVGMRNYFKSQQAKAKLQGQNF
jgi:hypothetical protein